MAEGDEVLKPEGQVKGGQPDPAREFDEEKLKMRTAKTLMTKKIKRLENAIADFEELKQMDISNKDLVGAAKEVIESRDDAKEAYKRIETPNEILLEKLIVLDRGGKVPDVEVSMDELNNAVEKYWEKWEAIRMGNKKTLMEADTTVKTTVSGVQTATGTVISDFIRFNPAPDT